jgi:hypothetical protein
MHFFTALTPFRSSTAFDGVVYLVSMDRDVLWCLDAETHFVTTDVDDDDPYEAIANHNRLVF